MKKKIRGARRRISVKGRNSKMSVHERSYNNKVD